MERSSEELKRLAKVVRKDILNMTFQSGVNGGHIGGALSSADILAVLYGKTLNITPENPTDPDRDRFILSKGHVAIAHYAVLAECGFIPKEELDTFEKSGSELPTHEVMDIRKGIEVSSGSLGYGLSIGVGCALDAKRKDKDYRVYVLLGDGECNEGSVWEATMAAVKFKLDNLTIIIDVNKQQLDGYTADIMPISNFKQIFEGYGCNVVEVNGNEVDELMKAFDTISKDKPTVVLAYTMKGKGIESIEGELGWHHVRISEEQYNNFVEELEGRL